MTNTISDTQPGPANKGHSAPALKWPILGLGGVLLLAAFFVMPAGLSAADHIGYMLRYTARVAFVLLLIAYSIDAVVKLFGVGRSLRRSRRYLGLSMALHHTVHFGYVVAYFALTDAPLEMLTIVFGGAAFVLMWAMAATSNDASMRWLGRRWRTLHVFGIHYLWLIFMQSFVGRLFYEDVYFVYPVLVAAGFVGLALRVWSYWHKRHKQALAST